MNHMVESIYQNGPLFPQGLNKRNNVLTHSSTLIKVEDDISINYGDGLDEDSIDLVMEEAKKS